MIGIALSVITAMGLCVAVASSTHAASLDRPGDGRVVLSIFGERLAFREKDAANVFLVALTDPRPPVDGNGKGLCKGESVAVSLSEWLRDESLARCLFGIIDNKEKGLPDSGAIGVGFWVTPKLEDGLVYPGGIAQARVPPGAIAPRGMEIQFEAAAAGTGCDHEANTGPVPFGYQAYQENPMTVEYTLQSERRDGHANRQLCIRCTRIVTDLCAVILQSNDRRISFSMSWNEEHPPRPTWTAFYAAAREIADSIFSDRPGGYLQ